MTDTDHISDAQLDAIAALDVNLGDDTSIAAADWVTTQTLPEPPGRSEEARAFQAETERDSWAQFATELAERLLVGPAADTENLPTPEGNDLAAIVETLYEDRSNGTPIDDLDAGPLVRGWAHDRAFGFYPADQEEPF